MSSPAEFSLSEAADQLRKREVTSSELVSARKRGGR
jgi:hypothetical protein